MDEHLKQLGLGLLTRGLDFVVAKATNPRKSSTELRMEQIDRTLKALESAPEDGHRWTTPLAAGSESQKEAPLAPAVTTSIQNPVNTATVVIEPSAAVGETIPASEPADDEYCIGCGPNNHLAGAQSHIEEALRLSKGKGVVTPEVVAPRIQDAVAELKGYEEGDIKHMRERANGTLVEILDDLAVHTRELRNFLRYDTSGLEIGRGTLEDLEKASGWIRKLRQLGYYSVMVEVGQRAKAGEIGG